MVSLQARTREPTFRCDKTDSILREIETEWAEHHAAAGGIVLGVYTHLAQVLGQEGFIVDAVDGLAILEHCRRRGLPIVDILYALEERIAAAGYRGQRLALADFTTGTQPVYVFYDSSRFKTFEDLKTHVAARVFTDPAMPPQPPA